MLSSLISQRIGEAAGRSSAAIMASSNALVQQLPARVVPSPLLYKLAQTTCTRTPNHHQSRFFTTSAALRSEQQQEQQSIQILLQRWKCNFSRLYARRMLELAAASAATQRLKTEMQQGILKPSQQQSTKTTTPNQPDAWMTYFESRDGDASWTAQQLQTTMGATKLQRFWLSTRRIVTLSALASPLLILTPISYLSNSNLAWDYSLWAIEQSGPTLIKLVQWATTRQDLFSPEFCSHFGKLRDETRGHSWHATQKILQEDLGENWNKTIQLYENPIGSGCIAQVYKGVLVQPSRQYPIGTELAIKVQHPGIWQKVCVDFYLLGKVAAFLEALPGLNLSYLSIQDSVEQFLNVMLPQLDLRLEASHLKRFHKDFESDDEVAFPFALDEMVTPHVLTETFCHGQPVLNYINAPPREREEIARLGLRTVLKMIFLNDFVHGDLHPGNILVSKTKSNKMRLTLLDCGLVLEMGPDQHANLVKVLGAFTRRNGILAGQLMVDNASKCQASELDVELFINGIQQICFDDEENNFMEKVGDYITDICYLACKHKVKLEASFINAALAVEIIEGIASALYPDLRVQQVALPMVVKAEMMHRLPSFSLPL